MGQKKPRAGFVFSFAIEALRFLLLFGGFLSIFCESNGELGGRMYDCMDGWIGVLGEVFL